MLALGIDAAWTQGQPSGVALLSKGKSGWTCLAVAPSYDQFIALSNGTVVDWEQRPVASAPDPDALINAAVALAGRRPEVVALDIPLATTPITGRRSADDGISRTFGARGCGSHSPSTERPGRLADDLRQGLAASGYPLATKTDQPGGSSRAIEVYPHPALLTLLNADYRIPYKVSKVWAYRRPGETSEDGWRNLRVQWGRILSALGKHIHGLPVALHDAAEDEAARATRLKRFEDAIDALICAWVGARYLERAAVAHGDQTAAIWCPT